jgi:glycosyltransferase involved in cell wall biosynthesis
MNNKKDRLIVLWAEVMPYNVACFRDFVSSGGEIDVYSWGESKKLTPYDPPLIEGVRYFAESDFSASEIIRKLHTSKPDLVVIVGRMEKKYLEVAKAARKMNIPVAGCADNQYTGDMRQIIAKVFSRLLYRKYFDFMLVPGLYQYEYMRFLGFSRKQIKFPQYCADTTLFEKAYHARGKDFSQRDTILFTGRLLPIKGVDVLIDAFTDLVTEGFNGKLVLVGGGDGYKDRIDQDKIKCHGFLDQSEMLSLLPRVRVFCLPSRDEAWGLVIHEFTAAGLPVVTTQAVGASTAFVREGYNGFLADQGDKESLKRSLKKVFALGEKEWLAFSDRSYELSRQITPALWTSTVKSMMRC